ncbi:TlpA family protein disulfide reductase [Sediminicola luteus]|uniref:Thioredoxin domain-containing protein n=1 Tax=Sediminicola luteus TaxID=319238 RepID=A0A2A4G6T9_9FLAO|nr:redoxin domain-containing protein [Sediminicola luteus]PCE63696.1 hypothetical protein B7P33_10490 [Sediminicola luteus]
MNKLLLALATIPLFTGCGPQNKENYTFFGGEIVNPTSDYVILYKDEKAVDSCKLDSDNRFQFKFDTLSDGLYSFEHAPEYQYVYLVDGDSLVLRLNTKDFDESLVFDGSGKQINNFLLDMFLEHERELPFVGASFRKDVDAFEKCMDSIRRPKIDHFNEMVKDAEMKEGALKLGLASIDYPLNLYKEKYPHKHKKYTGENVWDSLPKDFYAHRKSLAFDNHDLTYYKPYYDFVKYYIDNLSYASCLKGCSDDSNFKYEHYHFNVHKLNLVDSLVVDGDLRDNLFRSVATQYYINGKGVDAHSYDFLERFQALSANGNHKKEVADLFMALQNMQPGNPVPDLMVENFEGKQVALSNIAGKKDVVFYFWTATQPRHLGNISRKIAQLSEAYPDFEFVGISIRTESDQYKRNVESYGLDAKRNFRSLDYKKAVSTLIIDKLDKGIVVRDGRIDNAFASIHQPFKGQKY